MASFPLWAMIALGSISGVPWQLICFKLSNYVMVECNSLILVYEIPNTTSSLANLMLKLSSSSGLLLRFNSFKFSYTLVVLKYSVGIDLILLWMSLSISRFGASLTHKGNSVNSFDEKSIVFKLSKTPKLLEIEPPAEMIWGIDSILFLLMLRIFSFFWSLRALYGKSLNKLLLKSKMKSSTPSMS